MSIFAISDLHLSFDEDKPMDIFGKQWKNHQEKIKKNWKKVVKENDLVLLPGDFSWAMYLKDMYKSFKYIDDLPGKKLLLKGNHDYWWQTVTSMKKYLDKNDFQNIDFLYNNSFEYEDCVIFGTRGWSIDVTDEENVKILNREIERFKISINSAKQIEDYEKKKKIACIHYPPIKGKIKSDFFNIMKENDVDICLYGHLHGDTHKDIIEGVIDGIEVKMVSCDHTNFELVKIN